MNPEKLADKVEMLKQVPLFSQMTPQQLEEIATQAEVVTVHAGSMYAKYGTPGSQFGLILSGEVQAMKYGKVLREMGEGDFFGEISLIDGGPRTATIMTKTDVNLLVVNKESFDQLLEKAPELQRKMINVLCQYLRQYEMNIS